MAATTSLITRSTAVVEFVHPNDTRLRVNDGYGISVYALEKNKMVNGEPNARASVLHRREVTRRDLPLELVGDGLLPADIDGNRGRMMTPRRSDCRNAGR